MKITTIVFVAFLLPFLIRAQKQSETNLEVIALKESLPAYLNNHGSSLACFSSEGGFYKMFSEMMDMIPDLEKMNEAADSLAKQRGVKNKKRKKSDLVQVDNERLKMKRTADSIDNILKYNKIYVVGNNELLAYKYQPKENEDLRLKEDWSFELPYLKEDFVDNRMHRMDSAIGIEYVDLVKQQIDNQMENQAIALSSLDNSYYVYADKAPPQTDPTLIINDLKIYRPVFNTEQNKGCYLISYVLNNGAIAYDFVFIQKTSSGWKLVETYPGHLIHKE